MLKIIKVRLEGAKGAWPDKLPNVLWAYQTTTRTPTGETLFKLTYGTEVVILIKVRVIGIRREFSNEEGNDAQLKVNLDCLNEVRTKASQRIAKY